MTELVAIVEKTAGRAHHGIHGKDIANVEQAAPSKNILSEQDEIHPRGSGMAFTRCHKSLSSRGQSCDRGRICSGWRPRCPLRPLATWLRLAAC